LDNLLIGVIVVMDIQAAFDVIAKQAKKIFRSFHSMLDPINKLYFFVWFWLRWGAVL
jgi:hypothetical protein